MSAVIVIFMRLEFDNVIYDDEFTDVPILTIFGVYKKVSYKLIKV